MFPPEVQQALEAVFGALRFVESLQGGCIHNVALARRTAGQDIAVKWNHAQHAGSLIAEVKGLDLLASAGALRVPEIWHSGEAAGYHLLAMEYIAPGQKGRSFWEHTGQQLAQQHQLTASAYGLDHHNFIGSLPQDNSPETDGIRFFAQHRLRAQMELPVARSLLTPALRSGLESLMDRLPDLLPAMPPSLLHGDLWSGNLLCDAAGLPVLIDPAVYYGCREAEIAYTTLFDHFPDAFYDAYQSVMPLLPGWRERSPIYNLYPLLVHLNLFGQGYVQPITQTLSRYSG